MRNLSPREVKFVECYFETSDIGKAAVVAGYSPSNANSAGNRLLKRDRVRKQLEAHREQWKAKNTWSRDRMISDLENDIREASQGDYPNWAAVLKAREMICKLNGFYEPDKQEINNYDVSISVLDSKSTPPPTPLDGTGIPPLLDIDRGDE